VIGELAERGAGVFAESPRQKRPGGERGDESGREESPPRERRVWAFRRPLRPAAPRRRQERLESEGEVVSGVEALFGPFLEAVTQDALDRGRKSAGGFGQLRRILLRDRGHRLRRRVGLEGAGSREHLVEDGAKRKDVGTLVGRLPPHLLGDMYPTVPMTVPGSVAAATVGERVSSDAAFTTRARPKSRILTRPSGVTNRFSGFRSR
jgi:hypothetical protein